MNSERNVLKLINDISNLTLFVVDQQLCRYFTAIRLLQKQVSGEVYSIILTLSALMPSIFIRVIISILLKNLF